MKPDESRGGSQPFIAIKFFDDILTELVGDKLMERFLCCSTCKRDEKERYFSEIGPGFEPMDSLEMCESFQADKEDDTFTPCTLYEKHKDLVTHHKAIPSQGIKRVEQEEDNEVEDLTRTEKNQKEPTISERGGDGWDYGMIIGNSEYDGIKGLSNLPTITTDRELISATFGNQDIFNIDFTFSEHPCQIEDYTNVENIIGQVEVFITEMEKKVKKRRGKGGQADSLLMFFSGHGGKVQGVDCILGVDGKPYPINSILHKVLEKSSAKKVTMILDCCRNRLNPNVFSLTPEQIRDAEEAISFDRVTRIWATEETHVATALSGATFAEALCYVLKKYPMGVKTVNLERILNKSWGKKQKRHPKMRRIVYTCKVDLNRDYKSMFPY